MSLMHGTNMKNKSQISAKLMRRISAGFMGAKTSDTPQGTSTAMSHKSHENKWYGVPCQNIGICFCLTPSPTSFLLRCRQM